MRSYLVGVSNLIAQGFDSFRTVSESSWTRKWYETFNAAMKDEVETATFCWRVPNDHGSFSVRSSRLLLAGTMLATRVTRRWSSAMVFPWTVCLCVLWRTLWRSSVAEWTCVHHRQHVGDALSGYLRAPAPCACPVVRAPTSLLAAQGRKTNLWTEGCSKCWQFKFVVACPSCWVWEWSGGSCFLVSDRHLIFAEEVLSSVGYLVRRLVGANESFSRLTASCRLPRICWISQGARCRGR